MKKTRHITPQPNLLCDYCRTLQPRETIEQVLIDGGLRYRRRCAKCKESQERRKNG